MFGYKPREEDIVETARQTIERLTDVLKSPEEYLPARLPCTNEEHPGAFESLARDGQLICSRCLHDVEYEGDTLVRKHGAAQAIMAQ